jgi:hypothetical protein
MSNRVVITFAAIDHRALPWLVGGDTEANGTPVPLPEGLQGVVHNPPTVLRESVGEPDFWTSVVQIVVEHGDKVATAAASTLVGAWVTKKLIERDRSALPPTTVNVDQSVHNDVRVFVNKIEVRADQEEIARAVRDALDADQAPPVELPPAIAEQMAAKMGVTIEEWDEMSAGEDA